MNVFVAGATGVLGWRAVRDLVQAGHAVTGLARTPEKRARLERLGAAAATVDLFDPPALTEAVRGHDVVCNLATAIPPTTKAARAAAWADNNRIRSEGSKNLVDAALATGASRYVQESITFTYVDRGDEWIDEDTALDVPDLFRSVLDAEANARRFADTGATGVVLRFGVFYGPDSRHSIEAVRLARRRVAATVGRAHGYLSSINTDDGAAAVVAALAAPSGTYNVADAEPMRRRDHFDVLAAVLGVKPPWIAPAVTGRLAGSKLTMLMRSHRVSNRCFVEATGWAPVYRSAREGWAAVVARLKEDAVDEP